MGRIYETSQPAVPVKQVAAPGQAGPPKSGLLFAKEVSDPATPLELVLDKRALVTGELGYPDMPEFYEGVDALTLVVGGELQERGWEPTVGNFQKLLRMVAMDVGSDITMLDPWKQMAILMQTVNLMKIKRKVGLR